jgi:hypothetical protein
MESTFRDRVPAPAFGDTPTAGWDSLKEQETPVDDLLIEHPLPGELLADLDDPDLVLTPGYIGTERRDRGRWARVRRATFTQRRSLLRLELAVVAVVAVLVVASVVMAGLHGHPSAAVAADQPQSHVSTHIHANDPSVAAAAPAAAPTPTTAPAPTPTTTRAPATTVPAPAVVPAAAPAAPPATTPAATSPPLTPDQMGAQALALVRYPWQSIPGYSIQFLPISEAPSAGFYGNTTFTWGQAGGTSVLYVYPGETVDRLAGITAFEIGHEVDAAAVEPQGGETQIENILGFNSPPNGSWAPNCDCAEQGYLSGWYAAAFSNYWSPGVGDWSAIAPEPSGATLTAVEPWLNPTVP